MKFAWLKNLNACGEAVTWTRNQRGTPADAWHRCQDGSWMLWLLARCGADHKRLVLAACQCARLSLHLVPRGEDRPRVAIETAEAWCRGEATSKEVRAANVAADAAVYATSLRASAVATFFATDAASAVATFAASTSRATCAFAASGSASRAASGSASAYAFAADTSARATERKRVLAQCADIVRETWPGPPEEVLAAMKGTTHAR